eukprot:TRINITY_DN419_c0_g1_i2.p1 TRINITY_DN419_c0_g1~~TRINITY_DN419_c0_g1_i2.p1  ORF type:complete len:738 (-),score=338.01 TRINITY_DN419_c0_g1_i2:69-2282(-)
MKRKGGPGAGQGGNKGGAKKQKTEGGNQQKGGQGGKPQQGGKQNQQKQGGAPQQQKKGGNQQQKQNNQNQGGKKKQQVVVESEPQVAAPAQTKGGKKGGAAKAASQPAAAPQAQAKGGKKGGAAKVAAQPAAAAPAQTKGGKKGGAAKAAAKPAAAAPAQTKGGKKGGAAKAAAKPAAAAPAQTKGGKKGGAQAEKKSPGKRNFDQLLAPENYTYLETSKELIKYLLSPIDVATFFKDNWEKAPLHIPRNNGKYYGNKALLTRQEFAHLAENGIPKIKDDSDDEDEQDMEDEEDGDVGGMMYFSRHLNAFTYEDGMKKDMNKYMSHSVTGFDDEDDEDKDPEDMEDMDMDMDSPFGGSNPLPSPIQAEDLTSLFETEKCTFQILHPQQYNDKIHHLVYLFEEYFSSLVGTNVYITPAGQSQGLAPHSDSAELFILQLSGSKKWKIYNPSEFDPPLQTLPNESSEDIPRDFLPEKPVLEAELKTGDLLYVPRGFVHEAMTTSEESNHITLSTYEKNNWASFVNTLFATSLKEVVEAADESRVGVPLNFVVQGPNRTTAEVAKEHSSKILELVAKLADNEEIIQSSMDTFGLDFMSNRIRPPRQLIVDDEGIDELTEEGLMQSGKARLRNPGWLLLVPDEEDEEDDIEEDEEEQDEEDFERFGVYTCLGNDRRGHMTGEAEPEEAKELTISSKVADFVKEMQKAYPEYVDIAGSALQGEEGVEFLIMLAGRGLIELKGK